MSRRHYGIGSSKLFVLLMPTFALLAMAYSTTSQAQTISNLYQLSETLKSGQRITRDVDLELTVCAASGPKVGVIVAQDETGFQLLQMGDFDREIFPGERIRIRHNSCLLREREMGVEISAAPVIDVDGLHPRKLGTAEVELPAGKIPLQLEWFNFRRLFALDVSFASSNESPHSIAASNLWHAVVTADGATNFLPGLRAECFEGAWDALPDFNLLKSAKTEVVSNFNLDIRSRDEGVGIRYSGHLEVPHDGRYRFEVWSDDGALLFLGARNVPVITLDHTTAPSAKVCKYLEAGISNLDEHCWITVEGRVGFVARIGEGVKFDLAIGQHVISVRLADAAGLNVSALPNSRVRVTGLGCGAMSSDQTLVIGRLFSASAKDLVLVEPAPQLGKPSLPITSVAQVQSLPIEEARKALPMHIRGTVTGAVRTGQEHWMTFQDDTRGIFVSLSTISNATPAFGELWEVEGHSEAGNFAPIIVADRITRLGKGLLPSPVKPTWAELLNGSRDVQWVELTGLVTDVHSNAISLHLPEGRLEVELEGSFESDLKPFLKAVVKIRGVLYAVWDAGTREVRVGNVMMRNSTISVDVPAPADPFDAVVRTPRELLLFDAQASAFRPVKVRGQIVYLDSTQLFLQENGSGLRLLPMEKTTVRPGDLVEAVGYPDIGKTQLLLREVLLRKTGEAPLPPPKKMDESALSQETLNSTRVRIEGKLVGWHAEEGAPVLEMLLGDRLYLARIAKAESDTLSLRPGSRLALEGVYVGSGHNLSPNSNIESFELLLNSQADLTVLSQPPWWTLPRLLGLVGVLLVVLVFTVIWNTQLRRLVEHRTGQLRRETRERERIEQKHALEAERSRIARDLHDDLGSSLTEISVLASTGQLPQTSATSQPSLFNAIGAKARSLVSALDVIVWAVDPEDNSLQSLADYLSGYTGEFFSHTLIACRFKVPVSFPPTTLEGRVRHELLMVVKEALNNIARHADASEVEFRMAMADDTLEIDITDNGKGINESKQRSGHGLRNLSARMEKLGGDCVVESAATGGTVVRIRLSLAAAANASRDQAGAS